MSKIDIISSTPKKDNKNTRAFDPNVSHIDKNKESAKRNKIIRKILKELETKKYNSNTMNIFELAECFANKKKEFYIGVTTSENYKGGYKNRKDIYTTNDKDEATLMKWILIHKLIFHENPKVCENIGNRMGGDITKESAYYDNYTIYFAHGGKKKSQTTKFKNGNLSAEELEEIVIKIINDRLNEYLNNDRMIKAGFATNLEGRIKQHKTKGDYRKNFEWLSSHTDHKILSTGTFESYENKLNIHDIRKAEIMFISQFMFLKYKKYSHLLINAGRGGDVEQIGRIAINQNADIYFLIGKEGTTIEHFRPKQEKFYREQSIQTDVSEDTIRSDITFNFDEIRDHLKEFKNKFNKNDVSADEFVDYLSQSLNEMTINEPSTSG